MKIKGKLSESKPSRGRNELTGDFKMAADDVIVYMLTNSMPYGIPRFNAAFIGALQ